MKNYIIESFLNNKLISQNEYDILFEDKENWLQIHKYTKSNIANITDDENDNILSTYDKIERFNKSLKKITDLQQESDTINLSYIKFLNHDFSFTEEINNKYSFSNCKFYGKTSFMNNIFNKKVNFDNTIFYGDVEFNFCNFKNGVSFIKAIFKENVFFNDSLFHREIYLKGAYFEKISDFSNSTFDKLELTNTYFNISNFNGIKSFNGKLNSIFYNKETARIIKSHYEKNHNLIEANKYFVIEQDKYYKDLSLLSKNTSTKIALFLNKYISNYYSSWIRVLIWIIVYALIVLFGYCYFSSKCSINNDDIIVLVNKAIELIDPLNMFKKDNNLYENHQSLGFAIRVISLYLFWQFIVAFRQNTKRK